MPRKPERIPSKPTAPVSEDMRLNKYLAHCGVASRREAADIIQAGEVKVNGQVVTDIGYKVHPKDLVLVKGKKIALKTKMIYILLNKPKDYIATVKDERGRKTVLDLVRIRVGERIYPVGRLDRNTTGLLLLTNDGALAQRLTHPKYEVKKIYHVILDKPLSKADFEQIISGVTLEDGFVQVDSMDFVDGRPKSEIGVEIHSGRNRIVRRIFEHLGYEVTKLDRVYFGGLTKKDLPRGRYRHLTEKEIIMLKHFKA